MTANKHTPGPWNYEVTNSAHASYVVVSANQYANGSTVVIGQCAGPDRLENARLIASAPELLEALIRAKDFIDTIRQELHQRRVADWYPEGAHNAAEQMSDDMRLLGNSCADFDVSAAIAKATGGAA